MEKLIFANANDRELNFKDKIFSVAAKYDEAVKAGNKDAVNATIGALIDDNGKLVVFQSVVDCLKNLAPEDYARYAPISGMLYTGRHRCAETFRIQLHKDWRYRHHIRLVLGKLQINLH